MPPMAILRERSGRPLTLYTMDLYNDLTRNSAGAST